jgi:hypothetical protein
MTIPSGSVDYIEYGICPENAHAERKHKGMPRSCDQLTVKHAAIMRLRLEIVAACLDVAILRFHIASSISWTLAQ